MKITIVTVTYNAEKLLESTINSILSQDYNNLEYIIIDGVSTDGTIDIIKKYEDKISYWISEPDEGIYDAMNKAIEIATGKYINFMNAGDIFYDENSVKDIVNSISNASELIYGDFIKKQSLIYRKARPKDEWCKGMPFCHQTLFCKTSLMKDYRFDTSFKLAADHDFILKMFKKNRKFQYIPKPLVKFDETGFAQDNKYLMSVESLYILLKYNYSIEETKKSWWFKVLKLNINDKPKIKNVGFEKTYLYKLLFNLTKTSTLKNPINKYKLYKQVISEFNKLKPKKKKKQEYKLKNKYSIVSAVYNVEKYLEEYILSIINQKNGFKDNVFLIFIDDGSTDSSSEIIKSFQIRFPDNIIYIRKENGGQASARNLGLEYVNTDWVTFMDPDDFVSHDYFYEIDNFITKKENSSISCISCNLIFFMENDKSLKKHYLSYRFKEKEKVVNPCNMENLIQTTANSVLFKHELIRKNNLLFDERIKPAYEDGDFVNRYFMSNDTNDIVFLNKPKYFYRKRSDGTSTLDGAWKKPQRFGNAIEFGLLNLLIDAKDRYSYVPVYLQRYVLYHLSFYFNKVIFKDFLLDFLSIEEKNNFYKLLIKIFQYIDIETIKKTKLGTMYHKLKLGLLFYYKNYLYFEEKIYYIDEYDKDTGLCKIRFYNITNDFTEVFKLNNKNLDIYKYTNKSFYLDGNFFINEFIIELNIKGHWEYLIVELNNCKVVKFSYKNKRYINSIQLINLKGEQ